MWVQAIVKGSICIRRVVRSGRTTLSLERKSQDDIGMSARLSDERGY